MQDSYWSRFTDSRLSRRRALAITGGTALGAAFLAACGGSGGSDGGGSSAPKDNSGLLTQLKDESSVAKRGGTMVGVHPGVILSWDPFKTGINIRGARRGFSQLFRIQDGIAENTKGAIEGDLAESWELSPDKLTLTVKLDGGAGLPPVCWLLPPSVGLPDPPPLGGRTSVNGSSFKLHGPVTATDLHSPVAVMLPLVPFDKGTPVVRPVRKARDLARARWPSRRRRAFADEVCRQP